MKFWRGMGPKEWTKWLDFGGDVDHDADPVPDHDLDSDPHREINSIDGGLCYPIPSSYY